MCGARFAVAFAGFAFAKGLAWTLAFGLSKRFGCVQRLFAGSGGGYVDQYALGNAGVICVRCGLCVAFRLVDWSL